MVQQAHIDNLMRLAREHHQAGRLGPAEGLYRQVLAQHGGHADALHFLGVIAYQVQKPDVAVEMIRASLVVHPENALAYMNLSAACRAAGLYTEAVQAARRAVELAPTSGGAFGNLGNALGELGQLDQALAAHRRAVELRPNHATDWSNLGACLVDLTSRQSDLAQTAACIAHLDLVITVDTAIAHLAGAMNKPTWILLPFAADWRWQRGRDDSDWYPSARLFRQRAPGSWDEPIQQVQQQLCAASKQFADTRTPRFFDAAKF